MEVFVTDTNKIDNDIDKLNDIKRNLNITPPYTTSKKVNNYLQRMNDNLLDITKSINTLTTYLSEYISDIKNIERSTLDTDIYSANISEERLFEVESARTLVVENNTQNIIYNKTGNPTTTDKLESISTSAYYYIPTKWALEKNILRNIDNITNGISRSEVVDMLYGLDGRTSKGTSSFSDVPSNAWYKDAANWAKEKGISKGYDGINFGPNDTITRAQFLTMLWRYAGKPTVSDTTNYDKFNDVKSLNQDYQNAIKWASSVGITTGTTETTFNPSDVVTKAQATTFLYRYATKTVKPLEITNIDIIDKLAEIDDRYQVRDTLTGDPINLQKLVKDVEEYNQLFGKGTVVGNYIEYVDIDGTKRRINKYDGMYVDLYNKICVIGELYKKGKNLSPLIGGVFDCFVDSSSALFHYLYGMGTTYTESDVSDVFWKSKEIQANINSTIYKNIELAQTLLPTDGKIIIFNS